MLWKKSLPLVMALLLVFGVTANASTVNPWLSGTGAAGGADVIEDAGQRRAVATLAGLGVISNEMLYADTVAEPATRLETAELLLALSGVDGAAFADTAQQYADVNGGEAAIGYACGQKLMTGYTDGTFRPDAALTYNMLARAVVELMGYRTYALLQGGNDTAYLLTANRYGLLRGLKSPADRTSITKGELAQCLYSLLEQRPLTAYQYGSEIRYSADETLIARNLDIYQGEGVVEATEYGAVNNQVPMTKNAVRIDGAVYSMLDMDDQTRYDIQMMLGYNVLYYYREDAGDRELVFVWQDASTSEAVRIAAADLMDFSGGWIEAYIEETDDTEQYSVSQLAGVVRNGRYTGRKAHTFTLSELRPQSGYVTLVDQDLDGEFDIVLVESYETVLVDEVQSSKRSLLDKLSGTAYELPKSEMERHPLVTRAGTVAALSDVKPWQAVGVLVSDDGELVQIHIPATDFVTGTVTETEEDAVTIDGVRYELAMHMLPGESTPSGATVPKTDYTIDNIRAGVSGTFSLTVDGRIAAVQLGALSQNPRVGYLIDARIKQGIDGGLEVKLLSQDGDVILLSSKDTLLFDGEEGTAAAAVLNVLRPSGDTKQQLVRYRANGAGELTMLATEYDPTLTTLADPGDRPRMDSRTAEREWRSAHSKFEYNQRAVDPSFREFYIDKDTLVFTIPNQYNGPEDDSRFGVTGMSVFTDSSYYTVSGYDMDEEYTARYVVANAQGGTYISANDAPFALVSRITTAINAAGNEVTKLYMYYNGTETGFVCRDDVLVTRWKYASSDATVQIPIESIVRGDVVRIALDAAGELGAVSKLLPRNDGETTANRLATFTNAHGAYTEITYGEVMERSNMSMMVQATDGPVADAKLIFRMSTGVQVYVYDVQSDEMYTGDVSDIYDAKRYGSDSASYVMIRAKDNAVGEVIVFNYNR